MKYTILAAAAALALTGTAYAQVGPSVGATVYGPQGKEVVGTITAMNDSTITVDTGSYKAPLPTNAFAEGPDGPVISVTKDQINQMMQAQTQRSDAARNAALVKGAPVKSADGMDVGTIKSVEGDKIVLDTDNGPAALTRDQFAMKDNNLIVLFTQAQLASAIEGAGNAANADTDATSADTPAMNDNMDSTATDPADDAADEPGSGM